MTTPALESALAKLRECADTTMFVEVNHNEAAALLARLGDEFLNEDDHAALFTFHNQCSDMDADGYTVAKEDMQRLAELGCVRHMGFGRYEVTRFGDWIIESTFLQNPTLPLKTIAEYNAEQARKVPRG